jgi:hypothetical protein
MKSAEDIESYLLRIGVPAERADAGIWIVKLDGHENLVVSIAGPVVAFRLKVMDVPAGGREPLFRTLLTLNTTEMVHGAFGLEAEAVVIVHALELENLDFNEFQAVIDDMTMVAAKHYPFLSKFVEHPSPASASAV